MESRARIADSDLGRRLFALEDSDLVALAEILERVVEGHEPAGSAPSETCAEPQPIAAAESELAP
jgi:hypothetical protein